MKKKKQYKNIYLSNYNKCLCLCTSVCVYVYPRGLADNKKSNMADTSWFHADVKAIFSNYIPTTLMPYPLGRQIYERIV